MLSGWEANPISSVEDGGSRMYKRDIARTFDMVVALATEGRLQGMWAASIDCRGHSFFS